MLKNILKGLGKGAINLVTGGLLDAVKENKIVNEVKAETEDPNSTISRHSKFYQVLDMYDDGELNESFSKKKAELISKAIGGLVTAGILIWQLIENL